MTESEPSPPRIKRDGYAWLATALYAFAGIVLPVIAFACAAPSGNWAADSPWQTSEFWVYATLVLKWPAVWPFYPLLLYSMTSMGLFLWNRQRFADYFLVRLGLYGGVILALMFAWLIYAPTDNVVKATLKTGFVVGMIAGVSHVVLILVVIIAIALKPILNRWGWRRLAFGAVAIAAPLVVVLHVLGVKDALAWLAAPFFIAFIACLLASPSWSFAAYLCASATVVVERSRVGHRWSLKTLFGLSTWLTCLFGAWRTAMNIAILEYATLPTEDPNCFICTAAARGHRRFVRSEVIRKGSRRVNVNDQLRTMKAAELALKSMFPRLHQHVRRVYNFAGPRLARRVKTRWAADAAYLALKPAEWAARTVLRLLGVRREEISCLYSIKQAPRPPHRTTDAPRRPSPPQR